MPIRRAATRQTVSSVAATISGVFVAMAVTTARPQVTRPRSRRAADSMATARNNNGGMKRTVVRSRRRTSSAAEAHHRRS